MVTETGNVPQPTITSTNTNEHGVKRTSENRRSNKPIMEKRRRARINNCLNQLKTLILDAMKKDPARHSKLEKADILEMTVKHLQNMQRTQHTANASDPTTMNKFRAGFADCASEVGRYPGLEPQVKRRLLQHLATCLNQQQPPQPPAKSQEPLMLIPNNEYSSHQHSQQPQQQHQQQQGQANIIIGQNGVPLVTTRLSNGDIALVLPNHPHLMGQQPPLLVPIPSRTSSTASASSSSASSHYSSSESPEPMEVTSSDGSGRYSPPMQKPLSLVMRRKSVGPADAVDDDDEKPWRPW